MVDGMLSELKKIYHSLKGGTPGRRFTEYHARQRRQASRSQRMRIIKVSLGLALVVIGFLLSLPPGVPGFLLYLPGLALIAGQLQLVAIGLDRTERGLRALYRWLRKGLQKQLKQDNPD